MRHLGIIRTIVASLALVVAACNAQSSSQLLPGDEPIAEAGNCCSSGAYVCDADGYELEYDALGCGARTKPTAQRACARHCGTECTDSGWIPSGLCR
jgi:hypothetical protein